MTIDEAIAHERELEKSYMDMAKRCLLDNRFQKQDECVMFSEEHKQLAEWLEELKAYRTFDKTNFSDGYNSAIDDFVDKLLYQIGDLDIRDIIQETAEQLKERVKNER